MDGWKSGSVTRFKAITSIYKSHLNVAKKNSFLVSFIGTIYIRKKRKKNTKICKLESSRNIKVVKTSIYKKTLFDC